MKLNLIMVKASDWVLKRNPKPARKDPMGPVAKVVLANRQSKPTQKTSLLASPAGLRRSLRTHAGPQTYQSILKVSILLNKSLLKIDITRLRLMLLFKIFWGNCKPPKPAPALLCFRVENSGGQIEVTYGDPSQGSEANGLCLQGELVDHPHRGDQTVLNNHRELRFLERFFEFAWIAARSMSSRLMVALVEESMIANKTRKGRW